jgi:membrane dipeptidase
MAIQNVYLNASDRAKEIVKDHIVIDTLNCVALMQGEEWLDNAAVAEMVYGYFDRAREAGVTAMGVCFDRAREAGVTAMGVCMYPDPCSDREVLYRIATMTDAINRYPDKYLLVRNSRDIQAAHDSGRLGIYFTFQGCTIYDQNPRLVGIFRQLGLGFSLLAYNNRYRTCDGAYEADNAGLTAWGRGIIDQQISFGMPIDITHVGIRASGEAIEYSQSVKPGWPVIYSHTGLKRWVDHTRAATDENARALAAAGGVMNINLCNPVVTENPTKEIVAADHAGAIDCAVQFLGIDHVGIATDDFEDNGPFMAWAADKQDKYPDGGRSIKDVVDGKNMFAELAKCLPAIVDVLLEKGYTEQDCAKIIGGNMMRVFEQSWDVGSRAGMSA